MTDLTLLLGRSENRHIADIRHTASAQSAARGRDLALSKVAQILAFVAAGKLDLQPEHAAEMVGWIDTGLGKAIDPKLDRRPSHFQSSILNG
jgi:hypothetical protein